jgi:hypothetical protein
MNPLILLRWYVARPPSGYPCPLKLADLIPLARNCHCGRPHVGDTMGGVRVVPNGLGEWVAGRRSMASTFGRPA